MQLVHVAVVKITFSTIEITFSTIIAILVMYLYEKKHLTLQLETLISENLLNWGLCIY